MAFSEGPSEAQYEERKRRPQFLTLLSGCCRKPLRRCWQKHEAPTENRSCILGHHDTNSFNHLSLVRTAKC